MFIIFICAFYYYCNNKNNIANNMSLNPFVANKEKPKTIENRIRKIDHLLSSISAQKSTSSRIKKKEKLLKERRLLNIKLKLTNEKTIEKLRKDPKNIIFLFLYESALILSFERSEYKGKIKEQKNEEVCRMLCYFDKELNGQ